MLTFNLKKEWFEKIKSGEKTHEYRRMSPYWNKRFLKLFKEADAPIAYSILYRSIINTKSEELYPDFEFLFACGYPSKDDKSKWLKARMITLTSNVDGKNTDLHADDRVYDVEFELVRE